MQKAVPRVLRYQNFQPKIFNVMQTSAAMQRVSGVGVLNEKVKAGKETNGNGGKL